MISGSVILINDHIEEKLDGLVWDHKDGHFKLKSLIQYTQNNFLVKGEKVKTALAIHQQVEAHLQLTQGGDGSYFLASEKQRVTKWANLYITPSCIIVDKRNNRAFVREIINKHLNLPANTPLFFGIGYKKDSYRP